MLTLIDDFLNQITMYRLVFYFLLTLVILSGILSFFGLLPFSLGSLLFSSLFLITSCRVFNKIFSYLFKVTTNFESGYITALILTLIISPAKNLDGVIILFLASFLAMASKYILVIKKNHIFNPAAFGAFLIGFTILSPVSWWVGNLYLLPLLLLGGFLIVKKIQKFSLVFSFLSVCLFFSLVKGEIFSLPVALFLATVMLTEPQTAPLTQKLQIIYGIMVGLLFNIPFHIGIFYLTPEAALLIGNIFSFIVSKKVKLILLLKEKNKLAPDIYDFVFDLKEKFKYQAGQYMEWTLRCEKIDSRGNRRYFTLASSPTENSLRIGVKFSENGSLFKSKLLKLKKGDEIMAGQLAGDFVLPPDLNQKLVFIAGGIGVTPFRSILKYLIDKKEKREIILFYCVKTSTDLVFMDIFNKAKEKLGIKIVPVEADQVGILTKEKIIKEVPDFKERIFYLSGPHSMVDAIEKTLLDLKVAKNQIRTDFFPGYV